MPILFSLYLVPASEEDFMHKIKNHVQKLRYNPVALVLLLVFTLSLVGCGGSNNKTSDISKPTLVFSERCYNSLQVHNRIAGFIIEHGYGYPVDYLFGTVLPNHMGLARGDIDIDMETWYLNYLEVYEKNIKEGKIKDLGINYRDAPQGWYVPTYMIKGDLERRIEPVAPDLKSISDLPKYWELFKDREVPSKGRFHNSETGWTCTMVNEEKFKAYELNKYYNVFSCGSDTAEVTSLVAAYEKGEPWLGYYWEPTWVMGEMDMTMLEEPPYDKETWDSNYGCAYPKQDITIAINSNLENTAPEVVEFLMKYETTLEQNNAFLSYMHKHDVDFEAAAIYFLEQDSDTWKTWIPEDVAVKVEQALKEMK